MAELHWTTRSSKPWSTAGPSTTLPCPVPVENRAPASSSSRIRPSPSSPPAAASMTCCNLRGRPHPFLRVPKPLRSVRLRSTTLVRLLHGLDLLPSGISVAGTGNAMLDVRAMLV